MNNFYMTIGLPASGKSSWAENMSSTGVKHHSSDSIREELFNNVAEQTKNNVVFETLHKRIIQDLKDGNDVVFDACNISAKRRMAFLKTINHLNVNKIAILFATPYEQVLINNSTRERVVPEEVITKMYKSFFVPQMFEGWDDIQIIYQQEVNEDVKKQYSMGERFICKINSFNQDNKHHGLNLGEHMFTTMRVVYNMLPAPQIKNELIFASSMHDIGKLKTKSFINKKGEAVQDANYFSHDNVSAYDLLFFTKYNLKVETIKELLKIIFYAQYHMRPFFWDSEKARDKFKNMVGEELYNDILILHEADKMAKQNPPVY